MGACASSQIDPKRIILLGHPNTGKTELAKMLTNQEPVFDTNLNLNATKTLLYTIVEPQSDEQSRARWIHELYQADAILYVVNDEDLEVKLHDIKVLQLSEATHNIPIAIFVQSEEEIADFVVLRTVEQIEEWIDGICSQQG